MKLSVLWMRSKESEMNKFITTGMAVLIWVYIFIWVACVSSIINIAIHFINKFW